MRLLSVHHVFFITVIIADDPNDMHIVTLELTGWLQLQILQLTTFTITLTQ